MSEQRCRCHVLCACSTFHLLTGPSREAVEVTRPRCVMITAEDQDRGEVFGLRGGPVMGWISITFNHGICNVVISCIRAGLPTRTEDWRAWIRTAVLHL